MATWVNLLDVIYPIGSVYITSTTTSPASLVGGTWTQITNKYLYCSTTPKQNGGSASHSHSLSGNGGACGDFGAGKTNSNCFVANRRYGKISFTPNIREYWVTSGYSGEAGEPYTNALELVGNTDTNDSSLPSYSVCVYIRTA
jgi:hypothetical protein